MYIEIAFFFRPGRGGERRGGGGGCLCFVLCRYCQVRYIHHTTYISYTCNFPCLEVDFIVIIIIIFMPRVLTIRIREILISRDSGREVGREDPIRYISKKTKHEQLF